MSNVMESRMGGRPDERLVRQFGLIAATTSAVFGVLYLLGLGLNLATSGSRTPPAPMCA